MVPVGKKSIAIEGFAVTCGQIMAAIGGLAGVRMLTEILKPDEYGNLSLGLTIALIANQIIMGPLGNGVIRFYAAACEINQKNIFILATLKLIKKYIILIGVISLLSVWVLSPVISTAWMDIIIAATFFAIISGAAGVLGGIQMAARHQVITSVHQGAEPWLRVIGAVSLVALLGASGYIALLGYGLGSAIILASQYKFLEKLRDSNANKLNNESGIREKLKWKINITKYSTPFAFWGIFTSLQLASDRWAIQAISGSSDVGVYSVLYQIGYYPITLVTGILAQTITPHLFERAGAGDDRRRLKNSFAMVYKSAAVCLIITTIMAIAAELMHEFIFSLLVAPAYRVISAMLPLMVIAGGIFSTGQIISLALQSRSTVNALVAPKIGSAILGILGNIIGAYFYGIEGILFSMLGYSTTYLVWVYILSKNSDNIA